MIRVFSVALLCLFAFPGCQKIQALLDAENPSSAEEAVVADQAVVEGAPLQWSARATEGVADSSTGGKYVRVGASTDTHVLFASYEDLGQYVVDVFEIASGSHFRTNLPMPELGAAVSVEHLVLFAAYSGVEIYDTRTGLWAKTEIIGSFGMRAVAAGQYAVFTGARLGEESIYMPGSDELVVYDIHRNTYFSTRLPPSHWRGGITSWGDEVYFGGGTETPLSDAVDIFNVRTRTWRHATLSLGRANLAAAAAHGKVLFAGGDSEESAGVIDRVDIYDTSTDTWTTSKLSVARSGLGAVAVGNKIVFAGGQNFSECFKTVDIYDAELGTWSTQEMAFGHSGQPMATDGQRAWVGGGKCNTDPYDRNLGLIEWIMP